MVLSQGSIQAALNGARVAMTPARLGREATAVAALGCTAVHLHVYDERGSESLAPRDVAAAVAAVKWAAPEVEVGVSTAAWITRDVAAAVRTWTDPLPDVASVNLGEAAHPAILRAVADRGIGIEAGLSVVPAVDALSRSGYAHRVVRAIVEPADEPGRREEDQPAVAAGIERRLDALAVAAPRLHHGEGPATWDVLRAARRRRQAVRIGLEDVDVLPDGTPAADNAALYRAALALPLGS